MTTIPVTRGAVANGDEPEPLLLPYDPAAHLGLLLADLLDHLPRYLPTVGRSWVGWVVTAVPAARSAPSTGWSTIALLAISKRDDGQLVVNEIAERQMTWRVADLEQRLGGPVALYVSYQTTSAQPPGAFQQRYRHPVRYTPR
nr:hypothetical protein [uncultured Actinotalea sp.]